MKKRKILSLILTILMVISAMSFPVFADINVDGGGGGSGGDDAGGKQSVWPDGTYGDKKAGEAIRVSVINTETRETVGKVVDFTNIDWDKRAEQALTNPKANSPNRIDHCTMGYNKSHYLNNNVVDLVEGDDYYKYWYNPPEPVPPIIKSNSNKANIKVLKDYFGKNKTVKAISDQTGVEFDKLKSGKYKIMIEPVMIFKYKGEGMALTATEIAIFDGQLGGKIGSVLRSISHCNCPFAMFLEKSDKTFPEIAPWTGSTASAVSNDTIYHQLGIGLIMFKEEPEMESWNYTYHCDTDVITAVDIGNYSKDDIGCDHVDSHPRWGGQSYDNTGGGTYADFEIMGAIHEISPIYIPAGGSQRVWVKWHTPSEPMDLNIREE